MDGQAVGGVITVASEKGGLAKGQEIGRQSDDEGFAIAGEGGVGAIGETGKVSRGGVARDIDIPGGRMNGQGITLAPTRASQVGGLIKGLKIA